MQSNSSIDSIDQLPFANDNAGTIKQRVNQYNSQLSGHANAISAHDNGDGHALTLGTAAAPPSDPLSTTGAGGDALGSADIKGAAIDANNSNILNDIGNMLANLTDELDAMLEEEKRAGLNDSE